MLNIIGNKRNSAGPLDVILAFVQSWDMHGVDEISVCSSTLDILRAYLGERPCCIWKNVNSSVTKISERGMVEVFYHQNSDDHQAALTRAVVSGSPEFDICKVSTLGPNIQAGYDGFLHVPIKIKEDIIGILTLAVTKKESRDRGFVQPLECIGRLVAISMQQGLDRETNMAREKNLRTEVESTTRELEQTNKKLIERVKELKALFSELQNRVQELTVANKTKDEFLSIVSHELRTPLTSLNGFLAVLLDEEAGPVNEHQKRFLSISKQSAERLGVLISDLLDFSRIESGHLTMDMKSCSLFDIVRAGVEGLAGAAEAKKIRIRLDSNPTLPLVWGDATRLRQVIDNLLSNAVKFSGEETFIDVSTASTEEAARVIVKDSGPGLSPEDQEKVFDMFYQVDTSIRRPAGGVGLGLAIAKGIVALHGGKIGVESEPGKGSSFHFQIPLSKRGTGPPSNVSG